MSKKTGDTLQILQHIPIFQKLQYQDISIILIPLHLKIRKKFLRPLIPLAIKKINLQKFWQMEKVNLSESLFRIFICIIILKC
mgnify:CR=1 FL=1